MNAVYKEVVALDTAPCHVVSLSTVFLSCLVPSASGG